MQKNKLPSLITLLILTLITILMWIGFSIYHAITAIPEPSVPRTVSNPLNSNLDTGTISKVESSLFFDESQIPQLTFTSSPVPGSARASATPVPIPTATAPPLVVVETPIPTPSPVATP